jgi:hypothetical protein
MDDNGLTKGIVVPSYCPIYSPYLLSFCNAASFEEDGKDGSLRQESVVREHGEAVNSADRQTAKAQFLERGEVNHVQSLNSTAVHGFGEVHVRGPDSRTVPTCQQIFNKYLTRNGRPISGIVGDQVQNLTSTTVEGDFWQVDVSDKRRTVHDFWQEYAYGLNGQEPVRARERRGITWHQYPIDPKEGQSLSALWSNLRPIYLFIEMRITMGDSEAVAVVTCQEIVNNYLTRNGLPNWKVLSPLLRGVLDQEENAVTTCQQIFNEYLTRNGRPISGIVGDQVQHNKITVLVIWQEYAHGLNGQEPLREKERRGTKWRLDPIDPKTGKRGHALRNFWYRRHPIYLFIEMRIAMGDSEAVAMETCQEIVNNYLTRNGIPKWNTLIPLLRGVRDQKENAVTTCQQIFNKYLTRNDRPISGIVGDQVQHKSSATVDKRTVRDLWQEYAYGLNGQEPLRDKERRGKKWRRDPVDLKTGKQGSTLRYLWYICRPIYLFIEMRIAMGDSEAVAVETCQEIVDKVQNWRVVRPLLSGVLDQEKNAVTTCQEIFNKYLTRNGRPISGIVGDQVQNPE